MPLYTPKYPYSTPEDAINWSLIILIFAGILIIIVLITVFFVIPIYAEKFLNDRMLGEVGSFFNNNYQYTCASDFYNCANFNTKAQAQAVFDYCEQRGRGDIHRLDTDGNGKACENLD